MRINALPKGTSAPTWFRTRDLQVTIPLVQLWGIAPIYLSCLENNAQNRLGFAVDVQTTYNYCSLYRCKYLDLK